MVDCKGTAKVLAVSRPSGNCFSRVQPIRHFGAIGSGTEDKLHFARAYSSMVMDRIVGAFGGPLGDGLPGRVDGG